MSLSVSSDSSQESGVTSGQRPNSSPSPLLETFCYTWTGPSPYWTPFCSPPASLRANWRAVCFLRKESHGSKTEDRKSKDKVRDVEQDEIRCASDAGWQERQWEGEKGWEREKGWECIGERRQKNLECSNVIGLSHWLGFQRDPSDIKEGNLWRAFSCSRLCD